MKGRKLYLALGAVLMAVSSCVVDDLTQSSTMVLERINTLEEQTTSINASISELKKVDAALKESVEYLQSRAKEDSASIKKINAQITELQRQDSLVNVQMTELRAYTDSLAKSTQDWAEGTFATLGQFDELCAVVAQLDAKMDSLDVAHTAALNQAISGLETSMKDWVNEKFTDYYNMAQIDAKLEELRKTDSTLNKKIDDLSAALEIAKVEITAAYTEAINTAITELEGRLNAKIENDIAAAKSVLQSQIDAISEKVLVIQEQMIEVLSRIQSISVLPDLSDGSVEVVGNNATFEVRLAIYPLDAAQKIANNSYMQASFEVVETLTKSSSAFVPYTITGMRYEDELLKLTVSTSSVDTTFYSGEKRGFARVSFTNDKYQKASAFFPLTTIYNPTSISIEYGYYCILPGESADIKITLTPSYATALSVYSSNPGVVSVDQKGMVTAVRAGEASIIVKAADGSGLGDTCNVAVSPLTGIFSIAADKKVVFSPGYLRARKGAQSDWSDARFFFAFHQKDVLGSANIAGGALADEIDLFGWSAEGANAKWGISISCSDSDYSGTSFRDWGRNIGKGWKTMTKEEWEYLTITRPNASSLVKAPVSITTNEGKTFKDCSIIAPDNYNFTANPLKSSYSESEIEQLGLVAIYTAGYRYGININYFQERLELWTASPDGSDRAHYIYISTSGTVGHVDQSRYYGDSVRLVREVK